MTSDSSSLHDHFGQRAHAGLVLPLLTGRRVTLRRYQRNDDAMAAWLGAQPSEMVGGRGMGFTTTPDRDAGDLVGGHNVLFTVVRTHDPGEPVGFVGGYSYDGRADHISLGIFGREEYRNTALILDATVLLLDYMFMNLSLRWVRAEMTEWNYAEVASVTVGPRALFCVEGRQRDYYHHQGRYWDRVLLALSRTQWAADREKYLRFALASDQHHLIYALPGVHLDSGL